MGGAAGTAGSLGITLPARPRRPPAAPPRGRPGIFAAGVGRSPDLLRMIRSEWSVVCREDSRFRSHHFVPPLRAMGWESRGVGVATDPLSPFKELLVSGAPAPSRA